MKRTFILFVASLCLSSFLLSYQLTPASAIETNSVAQHWLILINKVPLLNKVGDYQIMGLEQVVYKGQLLCEIYHLNPRGHVVVSSYEELPPIISFSFSTDFDSESWGYEHMVLGELRAAFDFLDGYQEGHITEMDFAIETNKRDWKKPRLRETEIVEIRQIPGYSDENIDWGRPSDERTQKKNRLQSFLEGEILDNQQNIEEEIAGIKNFELVEGEFKIMATTASPLIQTRWGQGLPYYNNCPALNGKRCYVGCVATAMAQIMRYYKWPKRGRYSYSYFWNRGGRRLEAKFSDDYDWEYMPSLTGEYDTEREKSAVAELSYEVGVPLHMDYSLEGSGTYLSYVPFALEQYFKYKTSARWIRRFNYSSSGWFNVMKKQRDALRPVELGISSLSSGHAVVVDGYFISGATKLVHVNMGWYGNQDAYYNLNNIYGYSYTYWHDAVIDIIPDAARIQLNRTEHSFERMEGLSNPDPKYFDIKNSAGGSLSYLLTPDMSWITTTPKSGISYGEWDIIKVSVDISSLVEGKYSGKIDITSDDADNSPQVFHINLHVKPPPIHPPLNFSGVKVENRSLSQMEYINSLSWEKNPQNRNIEKYLLFLLEGDDHSALAEFDANTFKFLHRRVSRDKEYHYLLKAVNFKGRLGEPTEIVVR